MNVPSKYLVALYTEHPCYGKVDLKADDFVTIYADGEEPAAMELLKRRFQIEKPTEPCVRFAAVANKKWPRREDGHPMALHVFRMECLKPAA